MAQTCLTPPLAALAAQDLVRGGDAQAASLLRFMGLHPTPAGRPARGARTFYRVHSGSCAARISNYRDLLDAINGSTTSAAHGALPHTVVHLPLHL